MGEQSLWQIAGAIIMSVGGAGAIICAVIGFFRKESQIILIRNMNI